MPNSIIPHPPTELETKETAELGERTAHPFPRPEAPAKQPPSERPKAHRPAAPVKRASASAGSGNQGEGDRASAHRYEDHLRTFVASGRVEPAARDAARAVDGPEAAELRAAEERGKAPAKPSLYARAKGVVDGVRGIIHDLRERRRQRRHDD